jgi:hypothetical protein
VANGVANATSEVANGVANATSEVATRSVPANYDRAKSGPHRFDFPEGEDGYAEFEKASEKFNEEKKKARTDAANAANIIAKANPQFPQMKTGQVPITPPPIIKSAPNSIVGGSRKRRRIHKLSRRIERTLRRVQKKYGLQDDKNDFLRRTLRRGTYAPPQTPRKGQ